MLSPARVSAFALASLLILSVAPPSARGEWLPNGTPVGAQPAPQLYPRLTSDGAGGAFVIWEQGWSRATVQHVTATGDYAAGWPTSGRYVSTGRYRYQDIYAVLAPDDEGGVYVVWYMSGESCVAHCFKGASDFRVAENSDLRAS